MSLDDSLGYLVWERNLEETSDMYFLEILDGNKPAPL